MTLPLFAEETPVSLSPLETLDAAIREHHPVRVFALFSGGHDSLTSTHIASRHPAFSGAVHLNTGIGIEDTRRFVRETCARNNWPLLEYHPQGDSYEKLVLEKGLPDGPRSHSRYLWHLKMRSIRRVLREQRTRGRIGTVCNRHPPTGILPENGCANQHAGAT